MLKGGRSAIVAVPVAFGLVAFVFRALSVVDLANDHYMTLGWAQQVLYGAWPERDFVEPGMPLSYLSSAVLQRWWPGPFSELVFTAAMLALAAAVTCLCAAQMSGSWAVGIFAGMLELGFNPRFHSFHKILVPAIALVLLQAHARAPRRSRLVWLGLWVATAFLFRHDLGVYAGFSIAVGLIVLHWGAGRDLVRAMAATTAGAAIPLVPYALYVQWAVGWPEHIRRGVEFTKSETHQMFTGIPSITAASLADKDGAIAFLFYAVHVLLVVLLAAIVWPRGGRTRQQLAVGAAAAAALAAYLPVILREPVGGRLTDLAAVFSLALAWLLSDILAIARTAARTRLRHHALVAVAVVIGAAAGAGVWLLADVSEQIDNTGVYQGWRGLRENWADLKDRGTVWPWQRSWPTREMPSAVLYLHECTAPSDYLLLTWPAPEYYFFARRPFGAGHVEFLPPDAFTTPTDRAQMLERLSKQRIPIVLTNKDRLGEFTHAYPDVAAFLEGSYRPAGHFEIYDGSTIEISVRNDLEGRGTWGDQQWPCNFR